MAASRYALVDRSGLALPVIVTAQLMVVLDMAVVNVAEPWINTDLRFAQQTLKCQEQRNVVVRA